MTARDRAGHIVGLVASIVLMLIVAAPAVAAPFVGTLGPDQLVGTHNDDKLYGLNGFDTISGKPGDDELYGGGGEDALNGGKGADYLVGGSRLDTFFAGRGNDFVDAADAWPEDVFCGPGEGDRAALDEEDLAFGCEIINGEPQ
jgi:Ca2+-binding RTX toxin-like protein